LYLSSFNYSRGLKNRFAEYLNLLLDKLDGKGRIEKMPRVSFFHQSGWKRFSFHPGCPADFQPSRTVLLLRNRPYSSSSRVPAASESTACAASSSLAIKR